jgi:hypothetical protein
MDQQPKTQFSLRRLMVWLLAVNLAALFYWWVPEENPMLCGPLFLVKYWTAHRAVGVILTAICVPLLFAPLVRLSRTTVILSMVGVLLWVVSYYVIWQAHLGV